MKSWKCRRIILYVLNFEWLEQSFELPPLKHFSIPMLTSQTPWFEFGSKMNWKSTETEICLQALRSKASTKFSFNEGIKSSSSRGPSLPFIYGGLFKHNEMKDFKTDFISYVRRVMKTHKVELIFPFLLLAAQKTNLFVCSRQYIWVLLRHEAWSHSTRIFRSRNFPSSTCTSVESVDKNRSTSFLILWLRFDGVASLCFGHAWGCQLLAAWSWRQRLTSGVAWCRMSSLSKHWWHG